MPLSTEWPVGARSPHSYAPYRSSDRTDTTPRNAVFVAHGAKLVDNELTDNKQHNEFSYGMTKYFGSYGPTLTNETGRYSYEDTKFSREQRGDWRFSVDKFERLLNDAVAGVKAAPGREVPESVFADGWETIAFLDTIKGNELLVQTVADGTLYTKVMARADLSPELAKTFDKLDVLEPA